MTNATKMLAVALAACLSLAAAAPARAQVGIAVGARAPGAVVHTLDGADVSLDEYIGKSPIVMEFWATWCGNCKELEPQFLEMSKKYGSRVKFLGVAVSVNQSPRRVKLYAEKYHYPYQMVYDTDGNAVVAYDVPATSYVVVIDKSGKVVYTGLGGHQDLDAAIKKAL